MDIDKKVDLLLDRVGTAPDASTGHPGTGMSKVVADSSQEIKRIAGIVDAPKFKLSAQQVKLLMLLVVALLGGGSGIAVLEKVVP